MESLGDRNVEASAAIKELYREYLDLLVLDGYGDLESQLGTGGLVPLPGDPARFNIVVRLDGDHPIGEKDLLNQASYVAARPAAIGVLLDLASRVKSGPIEVTSLVRHSGYQESLRSTNANANTAVPMHTMWLAVDVALVNSSLKTVQETLAVLEQMRDAGEVLFIAERYQLVFHVVPHPSRLGYFTDVYARARRQPEALAGAYAISIPSLEAPSAPASASVSVEVADIRPTDEFAADWWAAVPTDGVDARVTAPAPAEVSAPPMTRATILSSPGVAGAFLLGAAVVVAARRSRYLTM
jgi:hypothetical protein